MVSGIDESGENCWILGDDLDVTNLSEACLFGCLLLVVLILSVWIIHNLYILHKFYRHDRLQRNNAKIIIRVNQYLLFTAIAETLQKAEQCGFYLYETINNERTSDIVKWQTMIYYILTQIKYTAIHCSFIQASYVWFTAVSGKYQQRIKYERIRIIWIYVAPFVICALNIINIITYLECSLAFFRLFSLFIQSFITLILFSFAVYVFYRKKLMPPRLQKYILISSCLLGISILVRLSYITSLIILKNEDLLNFKQYNDVKYQDDGWNWFIFLIIYQPLAGILPLLYLTIVFAPKNSKMPEVPKKSKTKNTQSPKQEAIDDSLMERIHLQATFTKSGSSIYGQSQLDS